MKETKDNVKKRVQWLLLAPVLVGLLYFLSFGPMEAFVIQTQDYCYPVGAELAELGSIARFYGPLVSTFDRVRLLPVLVSYVNGWYAVRRCVTAPFGCAEPYAVPNHEQSNVEPSPGTYSGKAADGLTGNAQE